MPCFFHLGISKARVFFYIRIPTPNPIVMKYFSTCRKSFVLFGYFLFTVLPFHAQTYAHNYSFAGSNGMLKTSSASSAGVCVVMNYSLPSSVMYEMPGFLDYSAGYYWSRRLGNDFGTPSNGRLNRMQDGNFIYSRLTYFNSNGMKYYLQSAQLSSTGAVLNAHTWKFATGFRMNGNVRADVAPDSALILAGEAPDTLSVLNPAVHLVKLDRQNNLLWARQYNHNQSQLEVFDVESGGGNHYAVFGNCRQSAQFFHSFITYTDNTGNAQWAKNIRSNEGGSMLDCAGAFDADGNILMSTVTFDSVTFLAYPAMVKMDSLGNLLWAYRYNNVSLNVTELYSVEILQNGNSLTVMDDGSSGHYLMEIDPSGNVVRFVYVPNKLAVEGYAGPSGNWIVTGFDMNIFDGFMMMALDSAGNTCYNHNNSILNKLPFNLTITTESITQTPITGTMYAANITDSVVTPVLLTQCGPAPNNVWLIGTEEFEEDDAVFSLYPNPSSGEMKVRAPLNVSRFFLRDMQGKIVLVENPAAENFRIDTESIPAGVYFAELHTESGIYYRRLVVAH